MSIVFGVSFAIIIFIIWRYLIIQNHDVYLIENPNACYSKYLNGFNEYKKSRLILTIFFLYFILLFHEIILNLRKFY